MIDNELFLLFLSSREGREVHARDRKMPIYARVSIKKLEGLLVVYN